MPPRPLQKTIASTAGASLLDRSLMATQLVAVQDADRPSATASELLVRWLVSRRVPISLVLFTGLVLLDMFVIGTRPRDVLNLFDPLVSVGLAMIVGGLALRTWAAGTLQKRRELARTGPYAWIRHPLYFGSFLLMIGFGTLVCDPISPWFVIGPVAWLYWQAVKSEERQIAALFPLEWPAYAAAVPPLIPRRLIWPRLDNWSLAQWLRNSEYQAWIGSGVALVGIKLWQVWP
jgi:protein-S-isoprenylcysteine O-methyltransferase Ste14